MAVFSDYYMNKVIDHMLSGQSFTPPATVYVALFSASTGLQANNPTAELSGGGYARQTLALTAASGGASENTSLISFPEATADWAQATHAAIVDHATNATWGTNVNVLMWKALTVAKTALTGDVLKINAGDLDVTVA